MAAVHYDAAQRCWRSQILEFTVRARADAVAATDLQASFLDYRQRRSSLWGRSVGGKFVLPYTCSRRQREMRTCRMSP